MRRLPSSKMDSLRSTLQAVIALVKVIFFSVKRFFNSRRRQLGHQAPPAQQEESHTGSSASGALSNKRAGAAEKVVGSKAVHTTPVGDIAETVPATATSPNASVPDQTDEQKVAALVTSSGEEKAMPESDAHDTKGAELDVPELTNVENSHIGKNASTRVSCPPTHPRSSDALTSNDPVVIVTDAVDIDSITQKNVLLRRLSFRTKRKNSFQMLLRTRSARKFGPSRSEPSLPETDDGPMEPSPKSFETLRRKLSKRSAR
jgi:hypothetical protein